MSQDTYNLGFKKNEPSLKETMEKDRDLLAKMQVFYTSKEHIEKECIDIAKNFNSPLKAIQDYINKLEKKI